jgi:hypothetical protein
MSTGNDESIFFYNSRYITNLKLNAMIGLVLLVVVTAVGTAMLLSILKIWGNHHDNNRWSESALKDDYLDRLIDHSGGHDSDRFLHPKDLSTYLFQYEMARRHQRNKRLKTTAEKTARSAAKTTTNYNNIEDRIITQDREYIGGTTSQTPLTKSTTTEFSEVANISEMVMM